MMNVLKWIQDWYLQNCDGDWEHCYGIEIGTLDNPGWYVHIQLFDTELEFEEFKAEEIERNELNWINCRLIDGVFKGYGGPENLEEILLIFKKWVESLINIR